MSLKLTKKQQEGWNATIDRSKTYILKEGGSRSGKTFEDVYFVICRALKYPKSSHLIARKTLKDCYETIYLGTFKEVSEYIGLDYQKYYNKRENYFEFWNGSTIWIGGLGDQEQIDKILGRQYATILLVEARQVRYSDFNDLNHRLNEKKEIEIDLKFILETNPANQGKFHWIYKYFFDNVDPATNEKLDGKRIDKLATIKYIPKDNEENIHKDYIDNLLSSNVNYAKRYAYGQWVSFSDSPVFESDLVTFQDVIEPLEVGEYYSGWDFGVRDPTYFFICQIVKYNGMEQIRILSEYQNTDKPAEHYATIFNKMINDKVITNIGDPSGENRTHNLTSWFSELSRYNVSIRPPSKSNSYIARISKANEILKNVIISEKQTPILAQSLLSWEFDDKNNNDKDKVKPIHDDHSHSGTAFLYLVDYLYLKKQGYISL